MELLLVIIKAIFRCSSLPLEIFLRHHFGTRYLNPARLIFGFLVLWGFWAVDANLARNPCLNFWNSLFFYLNATPVLTVFLFNFWPMAIYQKVIAFKSSEKEDEHSGSIGISFFGQRHFTFIIIEPAICLTLAALVYLADPQRAAVTVVWLIIAALDFFFGALRLWFRDRKIRLNIQDAQIDAQNRHNPEDSSSTPFFAAASAITQPHIPPRPIAELARQITARIMGGSRISENNHQEVKGEQQRN